MFNRYLWLAAFIMALPFLGTLRAEGPSFIPDSTFKGIEPQPVERAM
jgi:hypothetical protein